MATRLTFTVPEVADRLGVCRSTVYNKVNAGEWPYTRLLTRGIRFTQAQIDQILANAVVSPKDTRKPRRRPVGAAKDSPRRG